MRLWPRTLTARLVAVVLLLLAVAAAVIAVATTLNLRGFLVQQLDGDLRAAQRFELLPPPPGAEPGPRLTDTLTALISGGRVVWVRVQARDGTADPLDPAIADTLLTLTPGDPPRSVDLGITGVYRVVATQAGDGVRVVGLSEARVQATVAQLVRDELTVSAFVLLGAGALGLVLVRRELRPLQRVAATAARVSALPLDRGEVELAERVPVTDPATEVGKVGTALNRMLDHVGSALESRQQSETRLRQFIADASHELRTPLAAIRGYAELTRRARLSPDAAYSVSRISSQTERMTTLVEDLLLLARLDSGRPLERAPVDLTRLVLDTVDDAHAAGPHHRWQLDLPEEPVVVTGDASRLTQVLVNLLANARTHTPPGTAVTVALAATEDEVHVSVLDEGPGIPPELQPHVFERFARGSQSRSREHGSTGLGLAIVRAVVAAHAGRVELSSRPGRTEFRVTLPRRTEDRLSSLT
ncbi:two-component system, OmpR family, sensor kinase [Pseudonocardia thermophila]|jgi:Signal transduction histidine kinase|uniref:histidine kinase n=1 Tax=Pseudonocardia thermophila TaxID=1848 RepID=A0A1M6Q5C1_PSETH|nr:HAMP domain-containing sensor histidine kinase [Pseudonocardia thermophila]SHK15381.1 two-component system, OmpR family, sensor kinase [Pseudonocardia thermophila]